MLHVGCNECVDNSICVKPSPSSRLDAVLREAEIWLSVRRNSWMATPRVDIGAVARIVSKWLDRPYVSQLLPPPSLV